MRFFTALATFGFVALVSAQVTANNSTSSAVATSTSASAPASTSLSAEAKCLAACDKTNVCCQAACVGVPCPSQLQANATTECAGQCVQGNGSAADTQAYANCQSSCISSIFLSSSGATAAATGSGAASSGTAAATNTGIGQGSSSASRSATGSGATASSTGNAASNIRTGIAGAGLFGLIVAGLAL